MPLPLPFLAVLPRLAFLRVTKMAVTGPDLETFVGSDDATFCASCVAEGQALVDAYVGDSEVPTAILDRAVLEVSSELFHKRSAPQGIAQFADFDGGPVRVARDPMLTAYTLLGRWVRPF